MKIITLNGKAYANFATRLRNEAKVLAAYRAHMAKVGYTLPAGEWGAY